VQKKCIFIVFGAMDKSWEKLILVQKMFFLKLHANKRVFLIMCDEYTVRIAISSPENVFFEITCKQTCIFDNVRRIHCESGYF